MYINGGSSDVAQPPPQLWRGDGSGDVTSLATGVLFPVADLVTLSICHWGVYSNGEGLVAIPGATTGGPDGPPCL